MPAYITHVTVSEAEDQEQSLTATLSDQRAITAPLHWHPRLHHATTNERNQWRLIHKGQTIHWHRLAVNITLSSLLEGGRSRETQRSLEHWLHHRQEYPDATAPQAETYPILDPAKSNQYLQMLDRAEVLFQVHCFTEGSDLVQKATFQALTQAARVMNIPCHNQEQAYEAAKTIDSLSPEQNIHYTTTLLHAGVYQSEAENRQTTTEDQWDPEEFIEHLDGHRDAILELLAFVNAQKAVPA